MLAQPGGTPVPTPRGAATQMPPSVGPAPKTVVVAAHTRTVPTPKPKPAPSPLAAALPGVDQEAALRAQLAVTPSIQAAQAAQAQDAANTTANAKLLAGYYGALGPLLAQIAPGVQAGYQQAAGTDAILGSAFGGQLTGQDAMNAGQAASILQGQGAPAGQITVAQNATGSPGLGDALGWLNAGLPAQGLTQAGAAYGAAARMLPASVAGIGGQEIAQNNTLGAAQNATEQQKIDNAVARIPGLLETYAPTIARENAALASAQSLANYRTVQTQVAQEKVKLSAQVDAANVAYHNGELSAKQYADQLSAAKLKATQLDDQAKLAISQFSANTSRMNATTSAYRATHPSLKIEEASNGAKYVVNSDGTASLLPGALGQPKSKSATSSASSVRLIANHISGMFAGSAPKYLHDPSAPGADASGYALVQDTAPQSYTDAVNYALAAYNGNKTAALSAVNRIYKPGYPQVNGSPVPGVSRPYAGKQAVSVALDFMKAASAAGETKPQAAAKAAALHLLPAAAITSALKTVYGVTVKQAGGLGLSAAAPGIG